MTEQASEIGIANEQLVGAQGDQIVVAMPKQRMTRDQALLHAAWLVALADDEPPRFPAILDAVNQT